MGSGRQINLWVEMVHRLEIIPLLQPNESFDDTKQQYQHRYNNSNV